MKKYIILLFVLGCIGVSLPMGTIIPNDSTPNIPVGSSLDQAAIICLDWAWSVNQYQEVAGGVTWGPESLTCTHLTLGDSHSVEYYMDGGWLVQFHTHTTPGKSSWQDIKTVVQDDVLRRPGYVREPSGKVWVYECKLKELKYKCRERRVRSKP